MLETKNILLVGVGGQGIILASKVLSKGLVDAGFDVKMSEVHGMAQRGGSVTTQVRYGEKVYSPIIGKGQADILVAFEKMEAMRWIEYLKPSGKLVVNNYSIPSVPVLIGQVKYPEDIIEELKEKVDTTVIDAANAARELGNIRTQNIIMLGALVKALNITEVNWEEAIKDTVKEKYVDINLKAFDRGMELV
ncbi:indolepyruvate oxidoreductase subunit beta [Caloranaerobacter azorensis]|uniref:Indolepyruvate ferredoxin oxidoreductase beta subunit n=3 Tax=Caloranaerobacter azorensis TaxID=116090 RepID=A0A1M5VWY1_9FIRM|nr:indolepyruvate oxidoreductase subunit beta [Caloranaerobacter azorensis]KGG79620.1 indolepyruvate oxidoreductase subunit beta [Caloranaerobacter azorensis H53214]QIB27187.1 indolepyruvate oxidoreductase subunit beta [Caloranaerobacter azorensis]SHH79504.1 indolepyruvate ferredoxin oxidoreductase beta subunit [Caloranaerobacter azorensis DSM 13643]